MDVREKLVELIAPTSLNFEEAEYLSDYLVKNGVTVQDWVSVKDKLPDQNEEVLVIVNGKPKKNITLNCAYELAEYDPYEGWIMEMWPEWEGAVVTHWMPIPHPPKGE